MTANWRAGVPPNGETWSDFEVRIRAVWRGLREGPFPAAIVAHLGVNSVLAACIAGWDAMTFQQDYCEVLTLEFPDRDPGSN
jgi:broad specificity phosphatase PhoE